MAIAGNMRYLLHTPAFPCPPPWRAWEALAALRPPAFLWRDRAADVVWLGLGERCRFGSLVECRDTLAALEVEGGRGELPLRGFVIVPFESASTAVILPEILLRWQDGLAQLAVAASGEDVAESVIEALVNPPPLRLPLMVDGGRRFSRSAWIEAVNAARDAIRAGTLQKLVLARDSVRDSVLPIPVSTVLERLSVTTPGCYLFAMTTADGGTFLGASPEQLFRLDGDQLLTESLAGTRMRGQTPAEDAALADELLRSGKDAREQRIVTEFLSAALAALCDEREIAPAPEIRQLASVQHLVTPARGRLRGGISPDAILAALHPTPAVCGVPRVAARETIARLEPVPRGLYAGALGFVDTRTAEFAVSIRSAHITGSRAVVYGGAGILEDSDPLEEWNETSWKMRPLLNALGCGPQ